MPKESPLPDSIAKLFSPHDMPDIGEMLDGDVPEISIENLERELARIAYTDPRASNRLKATEILLKNSAKVKQQNEGSVGKHITEIRILLRNSNGEATVAESKVLELGDGNT